MGKLLLNFVRTYYNPNLNYTSELIKEWNKKIVKFIIAILFNGFFFWLVLIGLRTHFPFLRPYIFVGEGFWHLLSIPTLGLIVWYLENVYEWRLRAKKSGGKK